MSGGLGPTEDDVTRDAAAAALGRKTPSSPSNRKRFSYAGSEQTGMRMAEINRRQAYLIEGAEALPNLNRTGARAVLPDRSRRPFLLARPSQ